MTRLHREWIDRAVAGHEAALRAPTRPLSPMQTMVHTILLELGRNKELLALVDEFVDSAELVDEIRTDGESVLAARGISLPDGVSMCVVEPAGTPIPVLRFRFSVRSSVVIVDYHPVMGVSTRLGIPGSAHGLHH
ncbi:hypothetical protein H7X46_07755 [Pseudonocardia sp. C8]|uniref:hypothetical protein n=1 Tax=Pseudonocardia sp. C8 TaxID=2762759 RepID=UPI0016428C5B|nr:hypothetical protein [Pseudonocardia sp. C8]MBC3190956.1 hypothetical protein [Pseudonocardia sp. C8]